MLFGSQLLSPVWTRSVVDISPNYLLIINQLFVLIIGHFEFVLYCAGKISIRVVRGNNFNQCHSIVPQAALMLTVHLQWFSLGTFKALFCRIVGRHPFLWKKTYCRGSPTGELEGVSCLVSSWDSRHDRYIDELTKMGRPGSGSPLSHY